MAPMKLDGIMLNEYGGSTDDGVRSDISSENCTVIRHFKRFLEIPRRFRTSADAVKSRLFPRDQRPVSSFVSVSVMKLKQRQWCCEFDEKVRFF